MENTQFLLYHQIGDTKYNPNWNTPEEVASTPGVQTFDGVYETVYNHRYLIRPGAILFVTGNFIGGDNDWEKKRGGEPVTKYCTEAQLQELVHDHGCLLGWHTWTHRRLTDLTDAEIRAELDAPPWIKRQFFAYPYGSWNRRVIDLVIEAGFRRAFVAGKTKYDQFTVPRVHAEFAVR